VHATKHGNGYGATRLDIKQDTRLSSQDLFLNSSNAKARPNVIAEIQKLCSTAGCFFLLKPTRIFSGKYLQIKKD
jgi:hypothetical protein